MAKEKEQAAAETVADNESEDRHTGWLPDGTFQTVAGSGGREAAATWNPGKDLKEAVEIYGEEVVYSGFVDTGTRKLQNAIRTYLRDESADPENCGDALSDWRPDVSRRRTADPVAKAAKILASLTEDQIAALRERVGI